MRDKFYIGPTEKKILQALLIKAVGIRKIRYDSHYF